jgi:DNA-binding response OmpR family regulator
MAQLPLRGIHVLCIDDHADTLELLKYLLQLKGARVYTAATAQEGLELLDDVPVQVAIMDLGLPDQDGLTLMRELRHRDAFQSGELQVIMLTAYCTERDRFAALMAGAARFISKPFDENDLVESIRSLSGVSRNYA